MHSNNKKEYMHMHRRFILFLFLLCLPLMVVAQTFTVDGYVKEEGTDTPIAHAHVLLMPDFQPPSLAKPGPGHHFLHAMTDDQGYYLLEDVAEGDYQVNAGKPGYLHFSAVLTVDQDLTYPIFLTPMTYGTVEGVVTDADTQAAIVGAVVKLWPDFAGKWGNLRLRGVTDDLGFYSIENVPAGDYQVRACFPGYVPYMGTLTITEDQTVIHDIVLEPMTYGTLNGLVQDAATQDPVANALIVLCPSFAKGNGQGNGYQHRRLFTFSGDDGTYLMEEVPVGDYTLRAFAFGYMPFALPITITEGANSANIDLELWQ